MASAHIQTTQTRYRKRDLLYDIFRQKTTKLRTATISSFPETSLAKQNSSGDRVHDSRIVDGNTFKLERSENNVAMLSISYMLAESFSSSELKRLVNLIAEIRNKHIDSGELDEVLETCARFSILLTLASEDCQSEAVMAIEGFSRTIERINDTALSTLDLKNKVEKSIAEINLSYPSLNSDSDSRSRLNKLLDAAIGTGSTVLNVVNDAISMIPVPWIKPVVSSLVILLNAIDQTRSNLNEMKYIATTACEFVFSLAQTCAQYPGDPSAELKQALQIFTKELQGIAQECNKLSRRSTLSRFLQHRAHHGQLQTLRTELDKSIKLLQTKCGLHLQFQLRDFSEKFASADQIALMNTLPGHPSYDPSEYLEGSREGVIMDIFDWISKPNEFIFWMHSPAGLGKSTVAQELVNVLIREKRLAGAVFLTHLTTEQPYKVIQMIARQLGENHPRAVQDISKAVAICCGLSGHHQVIDYLEAYIMEPVRGLKNPYQHVIVLDGLDEWEHYKAFLKGLKSLTFPWPVKFVLISRPGAIESLLSQCNVAFRSYPLPPVSKPVMMNYFNRHFDEIDWRGEKPQEFTISRLADKADGLLIWAATVRSLLSHELDDRYPRKILNQILSSEERVSAEDGSRGQLRRLYCNTLERLFPSESGKDNVHLEVFLKTMVVLQEGLQIHDFASLIGVAERPAREIQKQLKVLHTRSESQIGFVAPAIQEFHASFVEFIQSYWMPADTKSKVTADMFAHAILAKGCLKLVFSELLPSFRGQTCKYSELRSAEAYAIRYWPLHLSSGCDRFPSDLGLDPSALAKQLGGISGEGMRRWAELFLCFITYKLAMILEKGGLEVLSYRIQFLEVGVRLQPRDVTTWEALGSAYDTSDYDGYHKYFEEEIIVLRRVLELRGHQSTAQNSPVDPGDIMDRLAYALCVRFEQRGDPKDLKEVISMRREVLVHQPVSHPGRSVCLNDLAYALQTRFEWSGEMGYLEEAISVHREVLELRPPTHSGRSGTLNNLASALRRRFARCGNASDLEESISMHREALDLRPPPHPDRFTSLNNLANTFQTKFEHFRKIENLEEAIAMHREAADLRLAPHPDRPASLNNLADALQTHFETFGDVNYLEEAISKHREVLDLLPTSHPNRSTSLSNLAGALQRRFEHRGLEGHYRIDLEEAISNYQEALDLRPPPHANRFMTLHKLANVLRLRFEVDGGESNSNDVENAIYSHQEALKLCPTQHLRYSDIVIGLALDLQARFDRTHLTGDLDEAILLVRGALNHLSGSVHVRKYSRASKLLASLLKRRHELKGGKNDLVDDVRVELGFKFPPIDPN